MDEITRRVQRFYTDHPYPGTEWQIRADSFPALLTSYVDREPWPRTLQLLDAGCGTGAALIPIAAMNPEARVVGVDVSVASLEEAAAQARRQGTAHLELIQADLVDGATLSPLLEGSPGGFDVIWLSGVLHHTSDPIGVLRNLKRLLAPDGVLSVMVYSRYGRMPVDRFARAVRLALPEAGLAERRAWAREVFAQLDYGPILRAPFDTPLEAPEAEFADRYLHPHARSYGVRELFEVLGEAGLRFLRWMEPRAWDPHAMLGEGPAADRLAAMPEQQRFEVLEQLFDHAALELFACHPERAGRPRLPPESLPDAVVAWNPQAGLSSTERRFGEAVWREGYRARLRAGPFETLEGVEAAVASAAEGPEPARTLAERAGARVNVSPEAALTGVASLLERELLYRPSETI
ncbi:MAG: methyltransferase domain-containing protein [Alphaproteobacteria bacterium]|nr:methyltransferase domain-containing protein [Alphaproteobacteria bacterium]